jgi:hypothetical protein
MMAATKQDIQGWFKLGKKENFRWMIIACDSFDYEDYPFYVSEQDNPYDEMPNNGDWVMEEYDLNLDMEMQLNEPRAHHLPSRESFRKEI